MKQLTKAEQEEARKEALMSGVDPDDDQLEDHEHDFLMESVFQTENPSTNEKEMVVLYQCDYEVCKHKTVWAIGRQIHHSDI